MAETAQPSQITRRAAGTPVGAGADAPLNPRVAGEHRCKGLADGVDGAGNAPARAGRQGTTGRAQGAGRYGRDRTTLTDESAADFSI